MQSLVLLPLLAAVASAAYLPLVPLAAPAAPVYALARSYSEEAKSQFHSQSKNGYDYGYAEPNGAKKETRHADGTVTGTYSHPLPDGRVLTNNYVADKYGFRSSLAPTAIKDFRPIVESTYDVKAPIVEHTVETVAVPQPAVQLTKSVDYVAHAAPTAYYNTYAYSAPAQAVYKSYYAPAAHQYFYY